MATKDPGQNARDKLLELERRKQAAVILEFRKIQNRLRNEVADLLDRIEKERRIDGNASPALLFEKARLTQLLDGVTDEIVSAAERLAALTTNSQNQAIDVAQNQAGNYPELEGSLSFFDEPATRELVGLAGSGEPLAVHFAKLAPVARNAMFDALFYGIATGSPNQSIAREIRDAIGGTAAQAMTIVRTETNRAYREASRKFYDETPAVIGWRWIAALDLNTCPICWALHGKVFKTKTKFGTHPNCRCVMVPVFANEADKVETGPKLFGKLTPAQQKTILGPRRFDLYYEGANLSDFVETHKSVFGIGRRIKPIARTEFVRKPRPGKPDKLNPVPPPKPVLPLPTPKLPGTVTPKKAIKPAAGFVDPKTFREQFEREATARRGDWDVVREQLKTEMDAAREKANEAYKKALDIPRETPGRFDAWAVADRERNAVAEKIRLHNLKLAEYVAEDRKALYVKDPAVLDLRFDESRGLNKDKRDRITSALSELERFISSDAWAGRRDVRFAQSTRRANYSPSERRAYIDARDDKQKAVIVHEVGHCFELSNDNVLKQTNAFLDYRTPGEKPQRLRTLAGRGYGPGEYARADKFPDWYVAKLYGPAGNQWATEVMSMGFQYFYEDPLKFAKADPEYFEFIYTLARGKTWSPPK